MIERQQASALSLPRFQIPKIKTSNFQSGIPNLNSEISNLKFTILNLKFCKFSLPELSLPAGTADLAGLQEHPPTAALATGLCRRAGNARFS